MHFLCISICLFSLLNAQEYVHSSSGPAPVTTARENVHDTSHPITGSSDSQILVTPVSQFIHQPVNIPIFNGTPHHSILGIDDLDLILDMIGQAHTEGRTDFYILDLGAGELYTWINVMGMALTNIQTETPMNIHLIGVCVEDQTYFDHNVIFSSDANGGQLAPIMRIQDKTEVKPSSTFSDHHSVFLYEYLSRDLIDYYLMLSQDFCQGIDLIFSEHTLNKAEDPANSLIRAYNLLRPGGLFLFEQFDLQIYHIADNIPSVYQRDVMKYYRQIDCFLDILGVEYLTRYMNPHHFVRNYSIVRRGAHALSFRLRKCGMIQNTNINVYSCVVPTQIGEFERILYKCFQPLIPVRKNSEEDYAVLRYTKNRRLVEFYVHIMQDSLKKYAWHTLKLSSVFYARLNRRISFALSVYLGLKITDKSFAVWFSNNLNFTDNV